MAIKKIFKSSLPHLVYVTTKGKNLMFTNHKHITDNAQDIAELEDQIKSQHPHIFVDLAETHIDTTLQDAITEAQREATLAVMQKFAEKNIAEGKNPDGSAKVGAGDPSSPSVVGVQQVAPQAGTQAGTVGMSAATLLGAVSSASLAGLSKASNTK